MTTQEATDAAAARELLRETPTMVMRAAEIRRLERQLGQGADRSTFSAPPPATRPARSTPAAAFHAPPVPFDATKAATPKTAEDAETDRLLRMTPEGAAIAEARRHAAEAALLHAQHGAMAAVDKIWKDHTLTLARRRELLQQTQAGRDFLSKMDQDDRQMAALRSHGTWQPR